MSAVVIVESKGDPDELLPASRELDRLAGPAEGRLARLVAPTEDGIMLVEIWESVEAHDEWMSNPVHREAVFASGMQERVRERSERTYATDRAEVFGKQLD